MCNFWNRVGLTKCVVFSCMFLTAMGWGLVSVPILLAEGGNGSVYSTQNLLESITAGSGTVSNSAQTSYYQVQEEVNVDSYINSILNPLVKKTYGTSSGKTTWGSKTYVSTKTGFSKFGTTSSGFVNLQGNNWHGYLALYGKGKEYVNASVQQSGSRIVITTSSHQAYGKKFSGTISSSGYIFAYDQRTGEDWTTHSGPASKKRIDLYDYVQVERYGYRYLDWLHLER